MRIVRCIATANHSSSRKPSLLTSTKLRSMRAYLRITRTYVIPHALVRKGNVHIEGARVCEWATVVKQGVWTIGKLSGCDASAAPPDGVQRRVWQPRALEHRRDLGAAHLAVVGLHLCEDGVVLLLVRLAHRPRDAGERRALRRVEGRGGLAEEAVDDGCGRRGRRRGRGRPRVTRPIALPVARPVARPRVGGRRQRGGRGARRLRGPRV
eukprot:6201846-Pleurochrysis_carterae.AAC.2